MALHRTWALGLVLVLSACGHEVPRAVLNTAPVNAVMSGPVVDVSRLDNPQTSELAGMLPVAERYEAASATDVGSAPEPSASDAVATLRARLPEARALLGIEPIFKDESELLPYLESLAKAKPVEAYDPEGFLQGLGIDHPRSPGKGDRDTFAAVRAIRGYSTGSEFGKQEIKFQVMAWKVAIAAPRSYAALAQAVNPALEARCRLRKLWKKPFKVGQTAHPTLIAANARYRYRLQFDPDVHNGASGTQPAGRLAYGTVHIAQSLGFPEDGAIRVGQFCDGVDTDGAVPYPHVAPYPSSGLDRHFNLDRRGEDSRLVWARRHLEQAIAFGKQTAWVEAEIELGVGLHSLQDAFAHGQITPYLHGTIGEYPDDVRYNPIGYVEVEQATRAYMKAYLKGVSS